MLWAFWERLLLVLRGFLTLFQSFLVFSVKNFNWDSAMLFLYIWYWFQVLITSWLVDFIFMSVVCKNGTGVTEDINGKVGSEWGSQANDSGAMVVLVYVGLRTRPILSGDCLLDDSFPLGMVTCFTFGCLWTCDLCLFLLRWGFWLWSGFLNNCRLSLSICLVCLYVFFCCGFFLPFCMLGFRGSFNGIFFLTDFLGLNRSCILIDGCLLFSW